ncbi:protein EMSY-LIKE 3 isoform X2 [Vigna radiata var. radiata]|uniref:Protein EMSY-LIKE 3 isoform X2 n=1 Tax=Vigna radiata var. radiata TaxID=3916 RepID=A0A3Q0FG03_VIGRR|nr:protein EMSY-LIKE 3 isoform X2 [Vigna radiata var. radiata]
MTLDWIEQCYFLEDDDLPPSHQRKNRFQYPDHATVTGNGRSAIIGSGSFPRIHNDMETQIHNLEQEAYASVLRAFKAQSDAVTWEKESLITELRKELRVSDEEHRELLSRVNSDDMIHRIREWRKGNGLQSGTVYTAEQVHNRNTSPTVSASRKKQKASQSVASLPLGAPSPTVRRPMQPASSTLKHGTPSGTQTKKQKTFPSSGITSRSQVTNQGRPSDAFAAKGPVEGASYDPCIGRKVWTRWPEDNHFYEAVITDYNAAEGRHALVYDMNSANETWEWVNLKEISPEDIRWEGEDPEISVSRKVGQPAPRRGLKKSVSHGGVAGAGRGRGMTKVQPKKDSISSQNASRKNPTDNIRILHTDAVIKEVEKVFTANPPDPIEMEKAKNMLKEHEEALVNAIARLGDVSDEESDGEPPFLNQKKHWKKQQHNPGGVRLLDGSDGDKLPRRANVPS